MLEKSASEFHSCTSYRQLEHVELGVRFDVFFSSRLLISAFDVYKESTGKTIINPKDILKLFVANIAAKFPGSIFFGKEKQRKDVIIMVALVFFAQDFTFVMDPGFTIFTLERAILDTTNNANMVFLNLII